MKQVLLAATLFFASTITVAEEQVAELDSGESTLHIMSIKSGNVAEVHRFTGLTGSLAEDGTVDVAVPLANIDTGIGIRDERMRKFLFDVANNPTAEFTAEVDDLQQLKALPVGSSVEFKLAGSFAMNGITQDIPVNVRVIKQQDDSLRVSTAKPVVVDATQFGYNDGIDKLQQLAGLPSISTAVPVTFSVVFKY